MGFDLDGQHTHFWIVACTILCVRHSWPDQQALAMQALFLEKHCRALSGPSSQLALKDDDDWRLFQRGLRFCRWVPS